MKILFATESYWPNFDGGAIFERRLALDMAKRGHKVAVMAPGKYYHNYTEKDGNTIIFREKSDILLPAPNYRISFWPFFSIPKIIREFTPDVIHIHNPALIGQTALSYAKRKNIPILGTNHFMPENILLNISPVLSKSLKNLIWGFLANFYNKCDFVTSPTKTGINLLIKYGLKTPSKPISNGINLKIFKPSTEPKKVYKKSFGLPDKPIILYLGRVNKEKRLDVLLRTVPEVLKENNVIFLLAGEGNAMKMLKKLSKSLEIEKNIIFYGRVPEEQKVKMYQLADLFAISSPAELQSIVTLEAVSCGLPVVACNVCALPELVHDDENGYLFPENDSLKMAEKIIKILKNPDLKTKMGKKSLDIAQPHSEIKTFDQFEELYIKLAERKYLNETTYAN